MGRGPALTDLFDKLTESGGQLVPVGRESGADHEFAPDSPFHRYVETLIPGDGPAEPYDRALLLAAAGSLLTLAGAAIVAVLPAGDTVRDSGFYKIGRLTLANFLDLAGSSAGPLALLAVVLLLVTGGLGLTRRAGNFAEALCVIQPVIGVAVVAGSAFAWITMLLVFALNLGYWVVLITLVALGLGLVLGLAAAVSGSQ